MWYLIIVLCLIYLIVFSLVCWVFRKINNQFQADIERL